LFHAFRGASRGQAPRVDTFVAGTGNLLVR